MAICSERTESGESGETGDKGAERINKKYRLIWLAQPNFF